MSTRWYFIRWVGSRIAAALVLGWLGLTRAEWFVLGYAVCELGWFRQIGETQRWKTIAEERATRIVDLQAAENRRLQQERIGAMATAAARERAWLDRLSASVRAGMKRRSQ